ncbi:MAG: peptidase S41 [Desulfobulbus propionicus]|nr:MAG: peptidase S41 [Desulfobulbus propionicus]
MRCHHLVCVCFFVVTAGVGSGNADEAQQRQEVYRNLENFANVLMLLQEHYVDEVDPENAIQGAINGMLMSLDPHSSYLSPEDFQELQEEATGSFTGIGIEITIRDGLLTAVSPIEGTPADRQGIQAGDQIVRINGESTKSMSLMDAVKRLKGKKGTSVTITIQRKGLAELKDFTLVRDVIPLRSVWTREIESGLIYARISSFQGSTSHDFLKEIKELRKAGPINGMILDLRNNPGGLLDQAVRVADIFLDEGVIVSTRGRDKDRDMTFQAGPGPESFDFPVVLMVNSGSASAAEIVAGALQDHKRAIVLGTESFGKGSVQTILPMPGGSGIRLTTARYYTPSGDSIQAKGIQPDMVVPLQPYVEDEHQDTRGLREQDLPGHFVNEDADKHEEEKPAIQEDMARRLERDNQLSTALIILKSLNIAAHN